jgi:hypothetical protein
MGISGQPSVLHIVTAEKQPENMEYSDHLGNLLNDSRCTREIKSTNAMAKAAFNEHTHFGSQLDLNLRKKLVKCYIRSITSYGAESWTLRKVDQKYLGSFGMWYRTMMEFDRSCEK